MLALNHQSVHQLRIFAAAVYTNKLKDYKLGHQVSAQQR